MIQKNENMNKENFFNEMNEKYPKSVKIFCDWIDKYKEKIYWKKYFRDEIKFHDIPSIFQIPIITDFLYEKSDYTSYLSLEQQMIKFFKDNN